MTLNRFSLLVPQLPDRPEGSDILQSCQRQQIGGVTLPRKREPRGAKFRAAKLGSSANLNNRRCCEEPMQLSAQLVVLAVPFCLIRAVATPTT